MIHILRITRLMFVFPVLIIYTVTASGQQNSARIAGTVYGPDNIPSEYSTVVLMNQDSVFMKGALSDAAGRYSFDGLGPGTYHVMVRNVEYQTHISAPITLTAGETEEMDRISLATKVTGLDEVVIRGEKAMVEVHPDKMVFNVSSSVNSTGNNGLELLGKSPGVIVDMDKNIILQGKSGVRIFINGRPSRLSGSDLTNMLEGMRSDNIESVEIITNPSAKYEAEGSGGIINIILKKNVAAGFNGNLIGSFSQGVYSRASAGTSLNYSGNKLNFYSTVNATDDTYMDNFEQTTLRDEYLLDMLSESEARRRGLNISAGADWMINREHTLSLDARILVNERNEEVMSFTDIVDNDGILGTEILDSRVFEGGPSENYNANLHYSFIPDESSSLTADVSYGSYSSARNTEQPNIYFAEDGVTLLRSYASEFDAMTDIGLLSAMVDYEKKIQKFTFSTGAKYSYISTDNSLDYFNLVNDTPVPDPGRSNDFSYLEKVAAAYAIIQVSPLERVSLNAGLRVENTTSLGELTSAVTTEDDLVARNYTSLFPNISASYSDQEKHALSLSFGRRITRPNYQDLNPFESQISELSSWKGNPFLRPNYITNFQVTYSFMRKLVISNTYSITRDFFSNIFITTDEKSNIITPRNMQRVTNNGLSVSYPLKVTPWWQLSAFAIYNYSTYDGDIEGTIIDLSGHIFNGRIQNNFRLPLDITMELSYYGSSPWIWRGTINVEPYHSVALGIRRAFFDERLQLQVTVNDLLHLSSDYYYTSNYGGMIVDGVRKFDNQRVGFSATYKFGNQQAKTSRRKQSAIDEELQRIAD